MNTKEEILEHLKDMLKMEGTALGMYAEIAGSVNNAALKSFFTDFYKEEEQHAKIVSEMISLLEDSTQESWHEPPHG